MYTHCADCDEELVTPEEQVSGLCVVCNPSEDGAGPAEERYKPLDFDVQPPRDYVPDDNPFEDDDYEEDEEYEHQLELDLNIERG